MNKYVFVLGKNKGLSLAEIFTIFNEKKCDLLNKIAIFDLKEEEGDVKEAINILGGTIKIGKIEKTLKGEELEEEIPKLVYKNFKEKNFFGKCVFGFSSFSGLKIDYKNLGIKTKQFLKEKGLNSRWINLAGRVDETAVSYHNKLDKEKGVEFLIIKNNDKYLIIKIIALQPFVSFSDRDYGRPSRDSLSGMLPPKLAKIMLNLAKADKDKVVLDPFCGSGTVASEAAFMHIKNIFASDISEKAILDTEKNLKWLEEKYNKNISGVEIKKLDASVLNRNNFSKKIDIIVTEPYLGPQRGQVDVLKTKKELEELYSDFLQAVKDILNKTFRIVMVWPIFNPEKKSVFLEPNFNGYKIINFPFLDNLKIATFRGTQVYGRPGQKIWREIVILEKK
jgi:tRNA G10  N-methylase Trm11